LELQNYICCCFDIPEDLARVALLSKHFYKLALNPNTWQQLCERKWNITKF